MKYTAVIDTDDYKDFDFFEDGNGKYLHVIDAGSENGEWIALYFTKAEWKYDKIRTEILEYIDDLDIAVEICDIFDKYKSE